jgi:hypothetical protein
VYYTDADGKKRTACITISSEDLGSDFAVYQWGLQKVLEKFLLLKDGDADDSRDADDSDSDLSDISDSEEDGSDRSDIDEMGVEEADGEASEGGWVQKRHRNQVMKRRKATRNKRAKRRKKEPAKAKKKTEADHKWWADVQRKRRRKLTHVTLLFDNCRAQVLITTYDL